MKTHILLTYSGSRVELTQEQHDKFIDFGLADKIIIDGHLIKGNNISEIVPLAVYYKDHPKETPTPEYKMLKTGEDEEDPLTRERYLNMARFTLKGLRKYIDESAKPTPTALAIAKKLVEKIKDAKENKGEFEKTQKELISQLN